jgi:hypothetical protein
VKFHTSFADWAEHCRAEAASRRGQGQNIFRAGKNFICVRVKKWKEYFVNFEMNDLTFNLRFDHKIYATFVYWSNIFIVKLTSK